MRIGAARAERDDARDCVERVACLGNPARSDGCVQNPMRRRVDGECRSGARIARSKYSGRHSAQPLHRLRRDGGACPGIGEDRQIGPGSRARKEAHGS